MEQVKNQPNLQIKMQKFDGDLVKWPDDVFSKWAEDLTDSEKKELMALHRNARDFYKRILSEEYRKKVPNSWRYKDAEEKIRKYNFQGKLLKELIDK